LVDRALPAAILHALDASASAIGAAPPFELAATGIPVYRSLSDLAGSGADLPATNEFANIPDAPEDSFIVQLDVETMENTKLGEARPFIRHTWHMFARASAPAKAPMLLRRIDGKSFQASGSEVTFGIVGESMKESGMERYRVRYGSLRPTARAEQVNVDAVELLGAFHKALGA
jgi:hypothetical protein